MKKIDSYISILAVRDLSESLSFFVDKLGFVLKSSYGNPMYVAAVSRDGTTDITLLHQPEVEVSEKLIATLSFQCVEIDSLYEEFIEKGVEIDEEIEDKGYGMREFRIKDPNGYKLYFQQKLDTIS